ncbi:MAG: Gfo/Idh/MocA family oxidoreductase [Candidatus Poribacteria bacterium]|nr:Gfo/Idh/MocA family oxidoreductase [Candidatus Poribacteria bacterium]
MASPKKVRVGFIGSGGIAQGKHVPGHQSVKGVEIVACSDISEPRAKAFAERNGIKPDLVFTDYHKMLEVNEIDAISVCTPNCFHADPTIAALNAGKHVICEKPLAGNAKDGKRMVDAQEKTGLTLQIGLQSRFNPSMWTLRQRIQEGILGDVYYGRTTALRRRGIPGAPTFIKKEIAGGGPLIDIGVHSFDLMLFLIGYPDPVEAFGSTWQKFGKDPEIFTAGWGKWNAADFDVEDMGIGQVKFANGATITLETSWAAHLTDTGRDFIVGDKAGASLSNPVKILTDDGTKALKDYNLEPLKRTPKEFQSFHDCVRKGTPTHVPPQEVLKLMKIFDAIYASAASGKSVKIK